MQKDYITRHGLDKLKRELEHLIAHKRPEIAERIKEAVSFGDLSENAEYADAKEQQAFIEGRICEIKDAIKSAQLVSFFSAKSSSEVRIGCVVEVEDNGENKKFNIVGKGEGDPDKGMISSDSPMGMSLLGRRAGEEISIPIPKGSKKCKIVRIA